MNEVVIFNNPEFGEVRTVTIDGEPWFVGKDVAAALGYEKERGAIQSHVDSDDALKWGITDSMGRVQDITIINESGLYSLIFGSRLDSAKRFKKWVTSEVLPSIRKNGGYISGQETLTDDELLEKALMVAQRKIAERDIIISKQNEKIEQDRLAVSYYNQCTEKKINTTFRDTAKELNMSQTQLTGWLRELGYIYEASDKALLLYEPYVKSGLFVVKDRTSRYGWSGRQAYVTPKGKAHLQLLIENDGINPRSKKKHGGRKKK